MTSMRAHVVRYFSKQVFRRITPDRDVRELRSKWNDLAGRMPDVAGVSHRPDEIAGIACEWLTPEGCDDAPLIYYLHGGAYLMGSPTTHRRLVSHIARASGMRAVLPDYRLAPEHRHPAALEDAVKVFDALVDDGIAPKSMAIAGDSAGGNLAVATLLALRDRGAALPGAAALLSPWLDLSGSGDSHRANAGKDPWFRPQEMPAIAAMVCDESRWRDPLVSPVFADASRLPPTLIQVGDQEILLSDSTRFAENLEQSGGQVSLQVWPGMWHVFQFFVGQMPESRRAINEIAAFLKKCFALPAASRAA